MDMKLRVQLAIFSLRVRLFLISLAVGVLGLAMAGGVAFAGSGSSGTQAGQEKQMATSDCGLAWRHVNSPSFMAGTTMMYDVDAFAANNIWAVGSYRDGNLDRTLT